MMPRTEGTGRSLGASLLLHVVLLLLVIFRPTLFSHAPWVIEQGKDSKQEVIEAMVVPESRLQKPPVLARAAPVVPKPADSPAPKPAPRPAIRQKQLLADLKKDIVRQKLKEEVLAEKRRILNARGLQKQLLQEKIRAEGERSTRMRGVMDHYRSLILQVISQNWRVPGIPDRNLSAELLIHLAPGGTVLDVQVIRSSGNPALDGSARSAVFRSSPLPVPKDPSEFEPFRSFVLRVVPEDILAVQ